MSKRRTADEIQRILPEVERDRAKGLTLGERCRKLQDVAKKKVVTAAQQRAAADYLRETFSVLQRRASRVLSRARSTIRYHCRQRSGEEALIKASRRLARRHPRYGRAIANTGAARCSAGSRSTSRRARVEIQKHRDPVR